MHKFPAAIHKAFKSEGEAAAFISQHSHNRGFAAGGSAAPLAAVQPAGKRRRKRAVDAAAMPAAVQECPSDGRDTDAEPDGVAAGRADVDDADDDAAAGAAMPEIWSSMLYRLVRQSQHM